MNESKVGIIVEAQDRASKILKGVSSNATAMGKKMTSAGKTMTAGLTLPILAMGTAVVKVSMDFEKSMANVSTLVDTSVESMDDMKDAVKEIAKRTPVALADLTSALYDIRSAGIDASDAMSVLEASAKLGVAGLGTTKEATTLMTLAVNNFRDSGLTASEVADVMFKTVKNGITTVGQLSQSFGLVAPLAQATGISLQELQAATAALTQVNKSASISQNSLKAALVSLSKPTVQAQELLTKLGVTTFKGLVEKSGGMVNAFGAMQDATEGNTQMFAKAIGSGEALTSVVSLLGGQSDSFQSSLLDMTEGANAVDEAYQKQKETFNLLWQELKNNVNIALLELGTELMPMLQKGAEWLTDKIKVLTEKWKKLSPETQKWVLILTMVLAVLPVLLIGLGMLVTAIGTLGITIKGLMAGSVWGLIIVGVIFLANKLKDLIAEFYGVELSWTEVWDNMIDTTSDAVISIIGWIDKLKTSTFGFLIGDIVEKVKAGASDLADRAIGVNDEGIIPRERITRTGEDDKATDPNLINVAQTSEDVESSARNNYSFDFRGANISDKDSFISDIKKSFARDIKLAGQGI